MQSRFDDRLNDDSLRTFLSLQSPTLQDVLDGRVKARQRSRYTGH